MDFSDYFPVWDQLTPPQKERLSQSSVFRQIPAQTLLHTRDKDCLGLLLIRSGQLRAFITSDEGREITIYRLMEMDICLFSASCMMQNIQFDISIQAEKDTSLWVIPADVFKSLSAESLAVSNYTNQLMASRFSEVMWLIEQVLWKSFDSRLAGFLLTEAAIEETPVLKITHEKIAGHLGTAREVVTRMLRYFQSEGMVGLSRGTVTLTDQKRLEEIV